jgi:hypothetical protein
MKLSFRQGSPCSREERNVSKNAHNKKAYVRPEVRQIKLSLAELTLGTNCDVNNPDTQNAACPPNAALCNV